MPIRSSVTISLVPAARGGPFVYWDDLEASCRGASALGFDAVEVFPPSPEAIDPAELKRLLDENGLKLAAVGTGAGWLVRRLTLTSPDERVRADALRFIAAIVNLGGPLGAPAIIGSMQGRWGGDTGVDRDAARGHLAEALETLGSVADRHGVPLIYEPLNRYETNMANTIADGVALVESLGTGNVVLLADLFHMNIEETNIADALRGGGPHIGHVHFVDSNRRPPGCGHIDFVPIVAALREIGYEGYASAEALPYPTSEGAAQQTIAAFKRLFT